EAKALHSLQPPLSARHESYPDKPTLINRQATDRGGKLNRRVDLVTREFLPNGIVSPARRLGALQHAFSGLRAPNLRFRKDFVQNVPFIEIVRYNLGKNPPKRREGSCLQQISILSLQSFLHFF